MSSLRKLTFAISYPDEFVVVYGYIYAYIILFFNIVASETSKKRWIITQTGSKWW